MKNRRKINKQSIIGFLTNKYSITILVFVLYLAFFQQNNWLEQHKFKQKQKQLQSEIEFYQKEISTIDKQTNDLLNNKTALEKFAREKYLMKKDNEIIIVTE